MESVIIIVAAAPRIVSDQIILVLSETTKRIVEIPSVIREY